MFKKKKSSGVLHGIPKPLLTAEIFFLPPPPKKKKKKPKKREKNQNALSRNETWSKNTQARSNYRDLSYRDR